MSDDFEPSRILLPPNSLENIGTFTDNLKNQVEAVNFSDLTLTETYTKFYTHNSKAKASIMGLFGGSLEEETTYFVDGKIKFTTLPQDANMGFKSLLAGFGYRVTFVISGKEIESSGSIGGITAAASDEEVTVVGNTSKSGLDGIPEITELFADLDFILRKAWNSDVQQEYSAKVTLINEYIDKIIDYRVSGASGLKDDDPLKSNTDALKAISEVKPASVGVDV